LTYLPPLLIIMFSFLAVLYSSLETDRQSSFGGDAANAEEENSRAVITTVLDARLGCAI
jgi:hypothetical protein